MYDKTFMDIQDVQDFKNRLAQIAQQIMDQMSEASRNLDRLIEAGFITGSTRSSLESGSRSMIKAAQDLAWSANQTANKVEENIQETVDIDQQYSNIFGDLGAIDPTQFKG